MTITEPTGYRLSVRSHLPAEVASFVGRERELAEITGILRRTRLITLTGTGGAGKTRLALRVAAGSAPSYADGVCLVQLAPVADSTMVARAVAVAAGVRGSAGRSLLGTLASALASRRLLLVLDNCEHLVGACARLAETLLATAPHLRILATSREPLRVSGETVWRVPALALPAGGESAPDALMAVESVRLFVERARSRRSDFVLMGQNAPAVAAICRRLDGLPLAIELAAAQMGALTPEEIDARLAGSILVLSGGSRTVPRQETLHAALDWSYTLLTERERVVFQRLAICAGGFDAEAAEVIASGGEIERHHVLPALLGLIEKSLVEVEAGERATRYRLLEPVRHYAWDRLQSSGELAKTQRRHAHYFAELTEAAEPKLMSGGRGPWMERLALEQNNLRAALGWSRSAARAADVELGLRIAGAITFFWNLRGETSEGLDWTEAMLVVGCGAPLAVRARALWASGELAWLAGQPELGRARVEEAERLFRELGDKRGLAYTLQSLPMTTDHPRGHQAVEESLGLFEEIGDAWGAALAIGAADIFPLLRDGDPTGQGRALLEEGLTRARAVDDAWLVAMRLNFLGDFERSQGDDLAAAGRYEEALSLLRSQDLTGTVPSLLHNLGYLALRGQDSRQALRLFRESLTMFRNQGDQRGIADCLIGLGSVATAMRQPERAAELFGSAEALREMMSATIWPSNLPQYEQSVAAARGQLEQAAFTAAWNAGRTLRPEQAVEAALGGAEPGERTGVSPGNDLTARERDVAALVAQGMTNRQIGAALFITEGTARLHVRHILQKLGFSSRSQIAAWAVEQGTVSRGDPG